MTRSESGSCSTSTHEVLVPPPSTPRMRSLTVGKVLTSRSACLQGKHQGAAFSRPPSDFKTAAWKAPLLEAYCELMAADEKEATKKVKQLRKIITTHDYRYYVKAAPTISDREYDTLYRELKDLEKQFPKLAAPD